MRATANRSMTSEESNPIPARTLLVLLWAFTTLLWSIFTPPHKTFAARMIQFQPVWLARAWRNDVTWIQDLALFQTLHMVYSYWAEHWRFATRDDFWWLDLSDYTIQLYLQVFSLLGICGLLAGAIVFREQHLTSEDQRESWHEQRIDEQVLPPLLIPSQTTHSRLFPRKHAFTYSYLLVGVPVGAQGRLSHMLSINGQKRSWFHIDSADYLERGSAHLGLAEKLKRYLHTKGVTDRDCAFAYLITAPKFLGYSFNPVSFWYLYDSDTRLKYMVLEVNNTFDERRVYLLSSDSAKHDSGLDLSLEHGDKINGVSERKLAFTMTWEKDFHVSPFNSRKGSYSLRATDPLAAYEEAGQMRIDNTIVLRSSKEHAKIVARVFSEGTPKDPAGLTTFDAIRFIFAWCWVGFATFPRIAWEALRLSLQSKLHVWYRPEVTQASIGRTYNEDERKLEAFFRAFLSHTVTVASKPLRVVYEPAHRENTEIVLYSPNFTYEEDHTRTMTIKVLSPAFYSRFVHYAHAKEAFDRECLATEEKNRTVIVEHANLLPILLDAMRREHSTETLRSENSLDQVWWSLLKRLRCPPAAQSYPHHGNPSSEYRVQDIRCFTDSEFDRFVRRNCEDRRVYRRIAMKLFMAERFAFGVPLLLSVGDVLIRSIMLLTSMFYSDNTKAVDVLRPRDLEGGNLVTFATTMALANVIHIWSFIEG